MIDFKEIYETNEMIRGENLDVRTITMGINLLDCCTGDVDVTCEKVYDKICRLAGNLVETGNKIGRKYGIPIVNKRISITPAALVGSSCCKNTEDFVKIAKTLDRAADNLGVNFIG